MNDHSTDAPVEQEPQPGPSAAAINAQQALAGLIKVLKQVVSGIDVNNAAGQAFAQARMTHADMTGVFELLIAEGIITAEKLDQARMRGRDNEAARLRAIMLSKVSPILMPGGHNGRERQ